MVECGKADEHEPGDTTILLRRASCGCAPPSAGVLQKRPAVVFELLGGGPVAGAAQLVPVLATNLVERLGRELDDVVVVDLSGIPDKSTYPNVVAIRTRGA